MTLLQGTYVPLAIRGIEKVEKVCYHLYYSYLLYGSMKCAATDSQEMPIVVHNLVSFMLLSFYGVLCYCYGGLSSQPDV